MKPSTGAKLSINIIGAGKAGSTLGTLWNRSKFLCLQDVVNSSLKNARSSVRLMGGGTAIGSISKMRKADVYMLSVPDAEISQVAARLAAHNDLTGSLVFHLSGALDSSLLLAAKNKGALIASAHPAKSFARSNMAVESFSGTVVALEGERAAKIILRKLFKSINASTINLKARDKVIYHASLVFASNYMQSLLTCGYDTLFSVIGNRRAAKKILSSLASEAVNNFFLMGPQKALTGPISRGDFSVVQAHLSELSRRDKKVAEVYRVMGEVALEIAQKNLTSSQIRKGKRLLGK